MRVIIGTLSHIRSLGFRDNEEIPLIRKLSNWDVGSRRLISAKLCHRMPNIQVRMHIRAIAVILLNYHNWLGFNLAFVQGSQF